MLEVLLALTLLALLLGVSSVGFRWFEPPAPSLTLRELSALRDSAIAAGRSFTWMGEGTTVRFEPDGSSSGGAFTVGGTTYLIDPLTGAIREQ